MRNKNLLALAVVAPLALLAPLGALSRAAASPAAASGNPNKTSAGCSWYGETDQRDVNIGAPDLDAYYWVAPLTSTDGESFTITGRYPAARYFSFTLYDTSGQPLDSIYDQQIAPDQGSANPYVGPVRSGAKNKFTVYVDFADRPADPAANTIYAGAPSNGDTSTALLALRVYVPTDPLSPIGGVPYPAISEESSSGTTLYSLGPCATEPIPSLVSDLIVLGWDEYTDSTLPAGSAQPPVSGATSPPTWVRQFGSVLANPQNAYLATTLSSQYGQVAVIRMRAPTFPNNRSGQPVYGRQQLRYWSFCSYDSSGETVYGCVADYDAVSQRRWVTYVISPSSNRPTNATAADGVNWLPWGPNDGVEVVYRNMLPSSSFPYAVQAVTSSTQDVQQVLGPYYPAIAYCSVAQFEAGGWSSCVTPVSKGS